MMGSVINAAELKGVLSEDYLILRVILFYKKHNVQKPSLWVTWFEAPKILDQGSGFPSEL